MGKQNKNQKQKVGKAVLERQEQLVKLSLKSQIPMRVGGGTRSVVTEFFSQSRKRILVMFARFDEEKMGFVCFVTLTYPDRETIPTAADTTRDISTFHKRIKRRFPESSGVWRREWVRRKSGKFEGEEVPHFHILFFNLPYVHYKEIEKLWGGVLKYKGTLRTEIKSIEDRQHAFAYVSKYVAKTAESGSDDASGAEEGSEPQAERDAGDTIGAGGENLRRADASEAPATGEELAQESDTSPCSLVYSTYHAVLDRNEDVDSGQESKPETKKTGRHWGVFNRKFLPYAESESKVLDGGAWIKDAKELAAEIYPPIADCEYFGGFTLFSENATEIADQITANYEQGGNDD